MRVRPAVPALYLAPALGPCAECGEAGVYVVGGSCYKCLSDRFYAADAQAEADYRAAQHAATLYDDRMAGTPSRFDRYTDAVPPVRAGARPRVRFGRGRTAPGRVKRYAVAARA